MTPTPKKYLKGTYTVLIHRGYDIMDKTQLIIQACSTCGKNTGLCYYSKTGKPRPDRKRRCDDCMDKAMREACAKDKSHMEKLSQ